MSILRLIRKTLFRMTAMVVWKLILLSIYAVANLDRLLMNNSPKED